MLKFKLDNLSLLLGLGANKYIAIELAKSGFFKVNGIAVNNANFIVSLFDVLQLDLNKLQVSKSLDLLSVQYGISFIPFFQPLWSIASFVLVRYPYNFELTNESAITDR